MAPGLDHPLLEWCAGEYPRRLDRKVFSWIDLIEVKNKCGDDQELFFVHAPGVVPGHGLIIVDMEIVGCLKQGWNDRSYDWRTLGELKTVRRVIRRMALGLPAVLAIEVPLNKDRHFIFS